MLVNLSELLPAAAADSYIVPGFNIFGMDEAWTVMRAAAEEKSPVILMVNKDMMKKYPVEVLGSMLKAIACQSKYPVCVHLDHTYEESIILRALDSGFSSVMFDGSQLSLEENIRRTRSIADAAHNRGISVEGEIGSVPYTDTGSIIKNEKTIPEEAKIFAERSGADAVAVSVGNVHKLKRAEAIIDIDLLALIETVVTTPLVLHGTSGISSSDLAKLVNSRVAKCNIGTVLRQAWGHTLRNSFQTQSNSFDRLTLTEKSLQAIHDCAIGKIRELGASGKA
ncbi:MAG: class II fructose-bisphosphate aldolase family protein [Bacteroidetes bacterium]|nr:class II fructose-bisphosphate aldolase family protein [Bacteroidota bacterium]